MTENIILLLVGFTLGFAGAALFMSDALRKANEECRQALSAYDRAREHYKNAQRLLNKARQQ